MRVVAGKYRGLRLDAPPGKATRPITDRVKEALFSILVHRIGHDGILPDLCVLDLFAGSGSLGIECFSRGAADCLFIERSRPGLRALSSNLRKLRDPGAYAVASGNVWSMRIPTATKPEGYDLIFLDPPYRDAHNTTRVLDLLERLTPRLAETGLIVYRHEAGAELHNEHLRTLEIVDDRTWGRMRVVLLAKRRAPDPPQRDEPNEMSRVASR